ncbi:plasmid partitioning protein RepB [Albimonas pacifica]|uniref:Chromosome partitioning protein, ParB family n=1 Tax=Albimonas pacifica TaxID=1114924 RepID=A0A1I3PSC9_9RHOB|nr:plasmid partitioning protein RepB [Albimonas pacifica]SFJ24399.1 chromosome partitioning protein, ParB family [Albimonas pacifica]
MTRKDRKSMLQGLMAAPEAAPAPEEKLTAVNAATRPRSSGAVGAISSAVSALRASGVLELDPATIHAGGLEDRLEDAPEDDAALRRSIAAHGQQVPILVRPHPGIAGEWQIVYGRRRLMAIRELGIRVRALVRDLDDAALVIAQGQENSARRDLTFIEKTSFADHMRAAGYDREAICQALSIDKTVASRMLSLADRLPRALIETIGAAHGVGRPRWLELADRLEQARDQGLMDVEQLAAELSVVLGSAPDPAPAEAEDGRPLPAPPTRFEAAMRLVESALAGGRPPAPKRPAPVEIRSHEGRPLARARRSGRGLTLALAPAEGFEDWLVERLPALHAAWREQAEAAEDAAGEGDPGGS